MKNNLALLWDIDGTLLTTNGLGKAPLLEAIKIHTGIDTNYGIIATAGFTDHQIVQTILENCGLAYHVTGELISQILDSYVAIYSKLIPSGQITVLNNSDQILDKISTNDRTSNWICTGNISSGAQLKLKAARLEKFFSSTRFFCSERLESRSFIVKRAVDAAIAHDLIPIVIGDTEYDVFAAREAGIQCIAVESENYPIQKLIESEPKAILNLGWNFDQLMKVIYGD
jgi:phosphoglycolate phosphatase